MPSGVVPLTERLNVDDTLPFLPQQILDLQAEQNLEPWEAKLITDIAPSGVSIAVILTLVAA